MGVRRRGQGGDGGHLPPPRKSCNVFWCISNGSRPKSSLAKYLRIILKTFAGFCGLRRQTPIGGSVYGLRWGWRPLIRPPLKKSYGRPWVDAHRRVFVAALSIR